MRFASFLLLAAASLGAQEPAQTGLTLNDFYLHDPWILAHEETQTYYLYTAAGRQQTGGDRSGTVVYKSKDLETWDGPHLVFTVPDRIWANPAHGAWAAEVHSYRGKYYLFVTLHNRDALLEQPSEEWRASYQGRDAQHHMRGTQIFVSDSPEGPFEMHGDGLQPPPDYMTLDGTLWVEDATPWMVYCHEWIQVLDGTVEAIQLTPDLSASVGDPIHLFKASDAPWLQDFQPVSKRSRIYVTDGPELYRTKTSRLLMLWSSYREGQYMQTIAYSVSGRLRGPWRQLEPIVGDDSGHGMLFHSFDGRLMLILHQPFQRAKGKLFEMEDVGDTLRIRRQLVY